MSKNSTNAFGVGAYLHPTVVKELDAIRGDIPRSRILERALIRYLEDVKTGQVSLVPEIKTRRAEEAVISAK